MSRAGAGHLAEQIQRSQVLLDRLERECDQYPRLDAVQHWQRCRLRETYADLRRQDRFRPACVFFLEELYGGRDMRERDRQLQRALPIMSRMLPDSVLHAVGEAMRLQAISMRFDAELSQRIEGELDQPAYARGYRRMGAWNQREEQIDLIAQLGRLLIRIVEKPLIRRLVRLMHRPAHAAGFGKLQEFLAQGLDAFSQMGDQATRFVETIVARESAALARMRDGDDWPFREWIGDGPRIE